MLQERLEQRAEAWPMAWIGLSILLHGLVFSRSCARSHPPDPASPFRLPTQVEFGLAESAPGGGDQTREPPQQPTAATTATKTPPRRARTKPAKAAPDPNAFPAQASAKVSPAAPAAVSGEGIDADGGGAGLGSGMGPGSGFAPAGANIALNVDMRRIRQTALMLETEALLDV